MNSNLPFKTKSINWIQKYPHIIESYACTLKKKLYFSNEFSNFFWKMFNPKLSKDVHFWHLGANQSNEFLLIHTHQDLLYMPLDKLFLE